MNSTLPEHFFRHAHGHLVAVLVRRVGVHRLESVEDAVQSALLAATQTWPRTGTPANPTAWLYRAAHNRLEDERRRYARRSELASRHVDDAVQADRDEPSARLPGELRDDLLRMLFVCCDDGIPRESQLVLALKTLCGFDVREIAERLLITPANAYKRLNRARARLRETPPRLDGWTPAQLTSRVARVRSILHAWFTEGHLSSHADGAIRRSLCDEALRLAEVLAEHASGAAPETFALVAAMHLHLARMPARQDGSGALLLLEEQDRSRWDHAAIARGLAWLARSAEGHTFSRYHAEAGIAAEHCLAPSFAETRWDRVVACYELLEHVAPSPLHTLNRALAVAELRGAAAGLSLLASIDAPAPWTGSHQWSAVLADLHRRCGAPELARAHREVALRTAPCDAVRVALMRRLA